MRRSNSLVRFLIARKPKHAVANERKMVGNSLFPTSLTDNGIRNREFGNPPPVARGTPSFCALGLPWKRMKGYDPAPCIGTP